METNRVFLFEVEHSRRGVPFMVRVRGCDLVPAQERVQRMHPLSTIRLVQSHEQPQPVEVNLVGEPRRSRDAQGRFASQRMPSPLPRTLKRSSLF